MSCFLVSVVFWVFWLFDASVYVHVHSVSVRYPVPRSAILKVWLFPQRLTIGMRVSFTPAAPNRCPYESGCPRALMGEQPFPAIGSGDQRHRRTSSSFYRNLRGGELSGTWGWGAQTGWWPPETEVLDVYFLPFYWMYCILYFAIFICVVCVAIFARIAFCGILCFWLCYSLNFEWFIIVVHVLYLFVFDALMFVFVLFACFIELLGSSL